MCVMMGISIYALSGSDVLFCEEKVENSLCMALMKIIEEQRRFL